MRRELAAAAVLILLLAGSWWNLKYLRDFTGGLSETLDLSRAERMFIEKNHEIFERLGFEVDTFGENTVKLNAIPAAMRQDNAGGVFLDILARITEDGTFTGRTDAAKLAQAACKAAVKAHDKLTMEECDALLDQMAQCELPYCCPHGRPTILHISLNELERRFGRK